jgi:hypothetical protein
MAAMGKKGKMAAVDERQQQQQTRLRKPSCFSTNNDKVQLGNIGIILQCQNQI